MIRDIGVCLPVFKSTYHNCGDSVRSVGLIIHNRISTCMYPLNNIFHRD